MRYFAVNVILFKKFEDWPCYFRSSASNWNVLPQFEKQERISTK